LATQYRKKKINEETEELNSYTMKSFVNYIGNCHTGADCVRNDDTGGNKYIFVENTQGGSILEKS
jgi:hypothetical protein